MKKINDVLDEMQGRCDGATMGPWLFYREDSRVDSLVGGWICAKDVTSQDGKFIAHSRTDMEKLIEALRDAIDSLKAEGAYLYLKSIEQILNGGDE